MTLSAIDVLILLDGIRVQLSYHIGQAMITLNTFLVMGVRSLDDFPAGALIGLIGGPLIVLISAGIVYFYTLYLLLA